MKSLLPETMRGRALLAALLLTALAVRLPSLTWGLPDAMHVFPFHPDEFTNVSAPRRMLATGDLNPRFFNYGSLYSYLVWLVYLPCDALGWLSSPRAYFLVARLVVLVCGLLSLPVLFALGRALGGEAVGLVAAGLFGLTPAAVMHGSFATVDVPSIFFALLSLWGAVRFAQTGRRRMLLLATVTCGFAAATKYPMGAVGLAALAALWTQRSAGAVAVRDAGLVVGGGASGFLLGCPYALLDWGSFWPQLRYELFEHSVEGHHGLFAATGNGFAFVLLHNLPYVLGPVLLLAGLVGLVAWSVRRPGALWPLLAFALPYYALVGAIQLRFMRYSLALAPVLCLGAAWLLVQVARRGRAGTIAAAAAAMVMAVPTALQTYAFSRPDPRIAALEFVERSVPEGERVGVMADIHWHSVPLSRFNAGKPAEAYGASEAPRWALESTEGWRPERLTELAPPWFVIGEMWWSYDDPNAGRAEAAMRAQLDRDYRLVHRDAGFPVAWRWVFGHQSPPHDWLYPFLEQQVWRRREPVDLGAPSPR